MLACRQESGSLNSGARFGLGLLDFRVLCTLEPLDRRQTREMVQISWISKLFAYKHSTSQLLWSFGQVYKRKITNIERRQMTIETLIVDYE